MSRNTRLIAADSWVGGTPAAAPAGLTSKLSGTLGPVLDPVFVLRRRVRVEPGGTAVVAFSTGVADTREEALALADTFNNLHAVTPRLRAGLGA